MKRNKDGLMLKYFMQAGHISSPGSSLLMCVIGIGCGRPNAANALTIPQKRRLNSRKWLKISLPSPRRNPSQISKWTKNWQLWIETLHAHRENASLIFQVQKLSDSENFSWPFVNVSKQPWIVQITSVSLDKWSLLTVNHTYISPSLRHFLLRAVFERYIHYIHAYIHV